MVPRGRLVQLVLATGAVLGSGCGRTVAPAAASGSPRSTSGTVRVGPDGGAMILIPAGSFTMGSAAGGDDADERPQRTIALDAYRIHQHEVTNAQYAAFLNARRPTSGELAAWIALTSSTTDQKIRSPGGTFRVLRGWERHPVVGVAWSGAQAYAEHYGLRLPTEAEWEKAARGSSDARAYPWGDTWDRQRVNASGTSGADTWPTTSPVGSFPSGASPYGVVDLAGNVWEWCQDWYDEGWYARMPDRDPVNDLSGTCPVLRGGAWHTSYPGSFRAAYRAKGGPAYRDRYIGFRCCAAP